MDWLEVREKHGPGRWFPDGDPDVPFACTEHDKEHLPSECAAALRKEAGSRRDEAERLRDDAREEEEAADEADILADHMEAVANGEESLDASYGKKRPEAPSLPLFPPTTADFPALMQQATNTLLARRIARAAAE